MAGRGKGSLALAQLNVHGEFPVFFGPESGGLKPVAGPLATEPAGAVPALRRGSWSASMIPESCIKSLNRLFEDEDEDENDSHRFMER